MDSVKIDLARDLLKNNKYSEALQVANELLAVDSSNREALWLLCTSYFELGDNSSAERNLRTYLGFDKNNVEAIYRLAVCIKRQGRLSEALALLANCAEQMTNPILSSELASLYLEQGDSDLAILHANDALQQEPDNMNARMVLGSVFILLGTPKEALKHLAVAREQAPSNPQVYINLAAAYGLLNDPVHQLESLNMALACDNSLHGLYLLIGDLSLKLQAPNQASEAFASYLSIDANSVEAHFGFAQAQKMLGEYELSKQSYLNVVREQPEHINAWCELGRLFDLTGQDKQASKCFERVIALDNNHSDAKKFFQK